MSKLRVQPAVPVLLALPVLEQLAAGVRVRDDEREALEVLLGDARERYGLTRACPTCGARAGELCRTTAGAPLRGVPTHAARRTLDLEIARG